MAADPKDVDRQTFDAQNFDAVVLCYLAAVAAGSTDGTDMAATVRDISAPPGDPFTWEELPDAIKALQNGDDIDYQGASGAIDMDENGDATAGVYDIYEYKGDGARPGRRGAREHRGGRGPAVARDHEVHANGRGLRVPAVLRPGPLRRSLRPSSASMRAVPPRYSSATLGSESSCSPGPSKRSLPRSRT